MSTWNKTNILSLGRLDDEQQRILLCAIFIQTAMVLRLFIDVHTAWLPYRS
jgi:hypothetical protein